jgi:hypothetical protein
VLGSEQLTAGRAWGLWIWPAIMIALDAQVIATVLIPYAHL